MKRKIIALGLAVVMTAGLAGCGSKGADTVSQNTAVSNNGAAGSTDTSSDTETATANTEPIEVTEKFVEYDIKDYVKLGDYKNMKVTMEDKYQVTEENLAMNVNLVLNYYSNSYEDTDKQVVEDGDVANIDYVGKKDGVAFDGGTASGYDLVIGSHTFIDGFEDGLIGVKVGETVDLNLTFPENYGNADLAGADVVFTVTLNKIKKKIQYTYDTVTDEYVNATFGYDTKEDFFDAVEAEMKEDYENNKDTDRRQAVLNELMNISEITIPDGLLDQKVEQWIQMYKNQVCRDTDLVTYLKDNYDMTEDEFVSTVTDEMKGTLEQELLLEALAEDMGFTVPDEEFNDYLKNSVTSSGYSTMDELLYVYSNQFETAQEYLAKNYRYTQALKNLTGKTNVEIVEKSEEETEDADKTEENEKSEDADDSEAAEDTDASAETEESDNAEASEEKEAE